MGTKRPLVVLAALALLSCSNEPGMPQPDGSGQCGPANCGGCCQGNACVLEIHSGACGSAGFPCVVCGPSETCQNGQCVGSATCGPGTCQGCCKGNQCMPGTTNPACGTGGALCMDCTTTGGICQAGACQGGQPCGPASCTGCCTANQCFGGGDINRCGVNGVPCVDCTETSKSCDPQTGTCVTGPPPTCGPANCGTGCCQGNQCLPGNTSAACGQGGSACADCTNIGKSCDPTTRLCTAPPPACGPGNCTGCCQNNQCLPGANDGTCGQGGVQCVDCSAFGAVCDAGGICQGSPPTCGPGNCAGCCQGNQCLSGSSDGACGQGGVPCQDCSQSGGTCDAGSGICQGSPPTCGPGNCNGCCAGTSCMPGTSASECGSFGAPCASCQVYGSCYSGACQVDDASKWEMEVIKASINQAKVWDSWLLGDSKKPDPYFGVDWDTCSRYSIDSPCSSTEDNTYDPVWYHQLGTFTAGKIKGGWCAFVGDADGVASCTPPFNTIALCSVKVSDSDLQNGSKVLSSCMHPDDGVSYITNLELKFTYAP